MRATGGAFRVYFAAYGQDRMAFARRREDRATDSDGADPRDQQGGVTHCRAIFISDIHLGTAGCKADAVLRFFDRYSAEQLYLLGDIMDVWANRNIFSWPKKQIAVLRRILGLADEGVEVYYLPGNHDRAVGTLSGLELGSIRVGREFIHETADRRRLLLTHGDAYDAFVIHHEWAARTATRVYHFITVINNLIGRLTRRRSGHLSPLSICRLVRVASKRFTDLFSSFATTVSAEALRRECDGVVCGHMHRPQIALIGDIQYHNAGDWMEHCTALVEDCAGNLSLVRYPAFHSDDSDEGSQAEIEALMEATAAEG